MEHHFSSKWQNSPQRSNASLLVHCLPAPPPHPLSARSQPPLAEHHGSHRIHAGSTTSVGALQGQDLRLLYLGIQ